MGVSRDNQLKMRHANERNRGMLKTKIEVQSCQGSAIFHGDIASIEGRRKGAINREKQGSDDRQADCQILALSEDKTRTAFM